MRVLIGLDDTDVAGGLLSTAQLARMLEEHLPEGVSFIGSVAHHLFRGIAGTSNNKSSCIILESPDHVPLRTLFDLAVGHVKKYAEAASAPGIVAAATVPPALVELGRQASWRLVERTEVMGRHWAICLLARWAKGMESAVGAAAAVGLTSAGWSGRWLAAGCLRPFDGGIRVRALQEMGVRVVSVDADADIPAPEHWVDTRNYLETVAPRLRGYGASASHCSGPVGSGERQAIRSQEAKKLCVSALLYVRIRNGWEAA